MVTTSISKPFVVIESPLRGDLVRNAEYADCLMLDSLMRGEVPFLGHLLYTRVLNDHNLEHRRIGIEAHLAVVCRADYIVVGVDLGVSEGMAEAEELALAKLIPVKRRELGPQWRDLLAAKSPTPGF